MTRALALFFPLLLLGLAGCAANGDPPAGPETPGDTPSNLTKASVGTRDVAILVLEQTPSSLRVVSSNQRPRSAFGPSASWNGAGKPTHRWTLKGAHGETLAEGGIAVRAAVEAPPGPQGPAANAPLSTFSFDVKVPLPAAGEAIEIAPVSGSLVARWP